MVDKYDMPWIRARCMHTGREVVRRTEKAKMRGRRATLLAFYAAQYRMDDLFRFCVANFTVPPHGCLKPDEERPAWLHPIYLRDQEADKLGGKFVKALAIATSFMLLPGSESWKEAAAKICFDSDV